MCTTLPADSLSSGAFDGLSTDIQRSVTSVPESLWHRREALERRPGLSHVALGRLSLRHTDRIVRHLRSASPHPGSPGQRLDDRPP